MNPQALRNALILEITAWIKAQGLSQRALAHRLGFSSGQEVSRITSTSPAQRMSTDRMLEVWMRIGGRFHFELTPPAQDPADPLRADRQNPPQVGV